MPRLSLLVFFDARIELMPGLHSPEKLAARRVRARVRGYLRQRPKDPDSSFVQVAPELAPRVKAVASSLVLHAAHNEMLDAPLPVAWMATRAVRSRLDPADYRRAMRTHDAANLAKHRWADAADRDGSPPPCCGAAGALEVPARDPASPPLCCGPLPRSCDYHSRSEVGAQTDPTLRAEAPEFLSESVVEFARDPWVEFYDVQNSPLALLCARLDECLPSQRRLREIERGLAAVKANVSEFAKTLSPTVDAKVREHLDKPAADAGLRDVMQSVDARFGVLKVTTLDMMRTMMEDFWAKTVDALNKQFEGLSNEVLAAPLGRGPCGGDGSPGPPACPRAGGHIPPSRACLEAGG